MFKKILLFLLLFLSPLSAFANFWNDIAACFSPDYCNCGVSNKTRTELWNIGERDPVTVTKDSLCPPYNREEGRDDHTCLLKKPYPGKWIGYYENLCGEETKESTYSTAKIRVRGQQCNFGGCWSTNTTLKWDGECVTLVGGYVFPLHRMCARVAMPEDKIRKTPQDPGYTNRKHLNWEGATEDDVPITASDGESIILDAPKLCLYYDPSFFSTESGFDIMDVNPYKQSFHKTSETHPIVKVIIFFVSNSETFLAEQPFTMLTSLMGIVNSTGEGDTTFGSVLNDMFSFLGDIIKWFQDKIIDLLKEAGQINAAVNEKVYGCVNIPMGPYPPPYCEAVKPLFQVAKTQYICDIGPDGLPVESNERRNCVVSNLRNNYINNSIRVGYDNFVPLCKTGQNPLATDKCASIKNLTFNSSSWLHKEKTNRRDIIKPCSAAAAGEPCVETKIPHKCSVTKNGCQDGFRVVYATKTGEAVTPRSYYRDDLEQCPSATSATCQMIWGINTGEFVDQTLAFDPIQTTSSISPLNVGFTLKDKGDRVANFSASIVRKAIFNPIYDFTQEVKQFCVFEGDQVVGCEPRAPAPKVLVYECGSNIIPGLTCTSSYFNPKMIVSYKSTYKTGPNPSDVASDSTSAVIAPETIYPESDLINSLINLAGDQFESFVTDDTFKKKPFSGSNSPLNQPGSLFGTYKNKIPPVEGTTINANALYMSGLEYINGKYHLGGKYACLSIPNERKCPENPNLCVKTKLLNTNTVRCSVFASKSASIGGMSLCSASQTASCTPIDSMLKIGVGSVTIRACPDNQNPNNQKCYDGSQELCTPSTALADRIKPDPSDGQQLSDSKYYDTSAKFGSSGIKGIAAVNYNTELEGLRDKTAVERGLCVTVPQGNCGKVAFKEDIMSYTWDTVPLGELSLGICQFEAGGKSYTYKTSPETRKCIADPNTQTFILQPLVNIVRDSSGVPQKEKMELNCKSPLYWMNESPLWPQ